ncbi:helix-turn-helix transcriptional regulator [Evansella clarkii]|uniref:helix-turn-helix transcriptional regulator n=1 Tax=Evansella clarkii TaxID=79879 RepID=UPI0014321979|nr:helix-turn-helix transcriptional regulator [Evansella clarkii]
MDGQKVKDIRHHLDLTQKELADETGYSRSYIALVEAGDMKVSRKLQTKLIRLIEDDEDFFKFLENEKRLLFFSDLK